MKQRVLLGYIIVIGTYLLLVAFGVIKYDSQLADYINNIITVVAITHLFVVSNQNRKNKNNNKKD